MYRRGGPFFLSSSSPRFNFEKMHKCGGSYIGAKFVLTAAHCIRDDLSEMRIRLGTNDMVKGGRTFKVHSVAIHKLGESSNSKADIAVIRVDDTRDQIAELWRKGELAPIAPAKGGSPQSGFGDVLLATGWGYMSAQSAGTRAPSAADGSVQRNPRYLRGIKLKALRPTACTNLSAFGEFAKTDIICAKSIKPGGDTCSGDSGGPLSTTINSRRVLVGIVSAGIGCGLPNLPSVYVNVAHFERWIQRAREKLETAPRGRVILMD